MVFTSYDFLIFFIIVFSLYWLARRRLWQNPQSFSTGPRTVAAPCAASLGPSVWQVTQRPSP